MAKGETEHIGNSPEVTHCTTLELLMNKMGYLIEMAEKVEVANTDPPQHHFIHHKTHIA
jgi:hypothetical protein